MYVVYGVCSLFGLSFFALAINYFGYHVKHDCMQLNYNIHLTHSTFNRIESNRIRWMFLFLCAYFWSLDINIDCVMFFSCFYVQQFNCSVDFICHNQRFDWDFSKNRKSKLNHLTWARQYHKLQASRSMDSEFGIWILRNAFTIQIILKLNRFKCIQIYFF